MYTAEICRLDKDALASLLSERQAAIPDPARPCRRRVTRWPFPGTVELWIPEGGGCERYELATSLNLSLEGVGVRSDGPLRTGLELAIAIHEPEVSFHGHAVVRHCTEIEDEYLIGLEFLFDTA